MMGPARAPLRAMLVVLALVAACASVAMADTCPLVAWNDQLLTEATHVPNMAACPQYYESSCCTQAWSQRIAARNDPISLAWSSHYVLDPRAPSNARCIELLQSISCLACSPSQGEWADVRSFGLSINVCGPFCSEMLTACGAVMFNSTHTTAEAFGTDGTDFCEFLFPRDSGVSATVLTHSDDCWDDTRACVSEDYYGIYSECDATGQRTYAYFKKPGVRCKGGVPPPRNVPHLACDIACEEGYYLPEGQLHCRPCQPGSFSLGGGERVLNWDTWDSLNAIGVSFRTYCLSGVAPYEGDAPCGWVLLGEETNSGALNDSMSSVLELQFVMVETGFLRFAYQVDAEPRFDGLSVYINRDLKMPLVSNQLQWTVERFTLEKGFHTVQFIYSKDVSISKGLDMAMIRMIEIDGMRAADSECSICPKGQFNPNIASRWCFDCPANTYASKTGASRCNPCPQGTYSYEGAASCTTMAPCDERDYMFYYTPCTTEGGFVHRTKVYDWVPPRICNPDTGVALPDPVSEDCTPCNPGEFRAPGEASCQYCPSGYHSSAGQTACDQCPPGTESVLSVSFTYFHLWNKGLSTNCSYNCGTPGWRLLESSVDSGVGHGHYSDSSLYLVQEIASDSAYIEFDLSFECSQSCQLTFTDNNGVSRRFYGGSFFSGSVSTYRFNTERGLRTFRWTFVKGDVMEDARTDRAVISRIVVSGTAQGGAGECTPCKPGTYSPDGKTCMVTPPGYYSPASSPVIIPCPDGEFNRDPGQGSCLPCGESTTPTVDRLSCNVDCRFSPPGHPSTVYDLTPLKRTDRMWGPVFDVHNHQYYINICTQEHRNNTCYDGDHQAILTYACQVTNAGYGEDIGDVVGFQTYHDDPERGVVIQMTHGNNCPPEFHGAAEVPRTSTLTMICDPVAGVGELQGKGDVENVRCHYEFVWRTLYACPLCTESDYSYRLSECNEDKMQQKVYYWINNPRACHGGVSLPENEQISCDTPAIPCMPGQYLDRHLGVATCKDAPAGSFSIGGGTEYSSWNEWPEGFKNGANFQGWRTQGDSIRSGTDMTFFFTTQEFAIDGSISFDYKVYTYGGKEDTGLRFYIDEELYGGVLKGTRFEYKTVHANVAAGTHIFKWVFIGGAPGNENQRERGARIRRITILNDYAASKPTPCPPGSYSSVPGSIVCAPCPKNTRTIGAGSTRCVPCEGDTYSLPGSATCSTSPPCTVDDYEESWSNCTDGKTRKTYVPLEPYICHGGQMAPSWPQDPEDCFECPKGHYRTTDTWECVSCPVGEYRSGSECVQATKGSAAVPVISYFDAPESDWPSGFFTTCSGTCGSNGWRVRGDEIDSGYHVGEVDSFVVLRASFIVAGSIEFAYKVENSGAPVSTFNGLEFFIDGIQSPIPYHPLSVHKRHGEGYVVRSFEVPSGDHTFVWNYHQEPNVVGIATMAHITVTGSTNGGAVVLTACGPGTASRNNGAIVCEKCPPGTFSSDANNDHCSPCPEGTFSEHHGSAQCTLCGTATTSNPDRTSCETTCLFSSGGKQYDLRQLGNDPGPWAIPSRNSELRLDICSMSNEGGCTDESGKPLSTHSCERYLDSDQHADMGRLMSVQFNQRKGNVTGIELKFKNGEASGCAGGRSTEVFLICDVASLEGGPDETTESPTANLCFLSLEWRTPYACHLCNDTDYKAQETPCENGKRQKALVRVSNDCFGPLVWGDIEETDCSATYQLPLLALIGIGVVFLVLVVIVVIVIIHNRRVVNQYSLLVSESAKSREMERIDSPSGADNA